MFRGVRPRLTIYVCQESQHGREQQQKQENGDAASNTLFGAYLNVKMTANYCHCMFYLLVFISFLSSTVYHAVYLEELTAIELTEKIAQLFNISPCQISQIYKQGPTGIHVLVSNEVTFYIYITAQVYFLCLFFKF